MISFVYIAIFDLEFDCDVTTYNIFLIRVIQPTQMSQGRMAHMPLTVGLGGVGWMSLNKKILIVVTLQSNPKSKIAM